MPAAPSDRRHPVFARFYAWVSRRINDEGMGELRDELLAGAHGRVVEVGAGNGLNLRRYPPAVTEVVAVEPEPYLRGLAERAARAAPVPVRVVPGAADRLPLGTASVDTGVVSLVLCSVPDPRAALAELLRVIHPGGQLRFLEHVVAESAWLRRVQRTVDATVWPLFAGGCHTARDAVGAITDVGFEVASARRLRFPDTRVPVPAAPHVIGVARRR
ncbi:MAG: class I SAM-dependent methyltransferase [Actinomycetota bacterium]|nr:class I SAM-dependent methyltransferase [Actinomycetota bacterium]